MIASAASVIKKTPFLQTREANYLKIYNGLNTVKGTSALKRILDNANIFCIPTDKSDYYYTATIFLIDLTYHTELETVQRALIQRMVIR